ncbi:MAG: glycogen/starch/alpha-glucan phosphorylase [Cyanobacteria bacterium P01_G01_bin.19]
MYSNYLKQHQTRLRTNIFGTRRSPIQIEDDRTGISIETLKRAIYDNLYYIQGKNKFLATLDCQQQVSQAYQDQDNWTRMSILNVARMGKFSSDRAIQEYATDIRQVKPVRVELDDVKS